MRYIGQNDRQVSARARKLLEIALAAMRKVPLLDWEEVPADKNEYLEPEESRDNAT